MNHEKILAELYETGLFDQHLSLNPIPGGRVNETFILSCGSDQFFLKRFEFNHIVPSDRQALFFQQQRLASKNKAPNPIYLSNVHDFQVEMWVEHISVRGADCDFDTKLTHLAAALFEIHEMPSFALSLDLPKDWILYRDHANLTHNENINLRLEQCRNNWVDTHKVDQVLCHNDLAMEHVAINKPYLVFDWEYAAFGNRYFDICACIAINELDLVQTEKLMTFYSQQSEIPLEEIKAKCKIQKPIVELTNELWFAAMKAEGCR